MALHFKKPVPAVHHIFKNAKTKKNKTQTKGIF